MSNNSIIDIITPVPRMRTIRQTAKETGFPEHALRILVKEDKITYVMCGSRVLINLDEFIKFLNGEKKQTIIHERKQKAEDY